MDWLHQPLHQEDPQHLQAGDRVVPEAPRQGPQPQWPDRESG